MLKMGLQFNMNFDFFYHKFNSNRELKRLKKEVDLVNSLEPEVSSLSDEALRNKFLSFKNLAEKDLQKNRNECFAIIREASKRVLGMRHFDVQLLGGMVLDAGQLAEMSTGEGKTLVITLAACFNALKGKGVHVVTVNPYLAQRDCELLRPLYEFLGLTVQAALPELTTSQKKQAYLCDITYCVNYELGFDYLRDNMAMSLESKVLRGQSYAIIDEVDSVLIDEARTPLIISGQSSQSSDTYVLADLAIRQVPLEEIELEEKLHQVNLTEAGFTRVESWLVEQGFLAKQSELYEGKNLRLVQQLNNSLKAHYLYHKDKDYVIIDNRVVIVDSSTGRLMPDRQWSEGLHQAVEAKESTEIKPENVTQATITYQRFFGNYEKLAGLTGTAITEAEEFVEFYGLKCVSIPTHRPLARVDEQDRFFSTKLKKWEGILEEVEKAHKAGQPVLVGTASVEESEHIDNLFKKKATFKWNVLNAKQNSSEAEVIALAGLPGAVTIATNMAGRGTDIMLGGKPPKDISSTEYADWSARRELVLKAGGLLVLGTERHDSRRVDNQLKGRSGRQGDIGRSVFMVCLEDHLLRVFGGPIVQKAFIGAIKEEGEGLSHPMLSSALRKAQAKLEQINFESRKQLMKYDEPLAIQRKAVYDLRDALLKGELKKDFVWSQLVSCVEDYCATYLQGYPDTWRFDELSKAIKDLTTYDLSLNWMSEDDTYTDERKVQSYILDLLQAFFDTMVPEEVLHPALVQEILKIVDSLWALHLTELESIKLSAGLSGYAQKNPIQVYQSTAFESFKQFKGILAFRISSLVMALSNPEVGAVESDNEFVTKAGDLRVQETLRFRRVFRMEPCPCGSGKRFKHCHGNIFVQQGVLFYKDKFSL